ncbi:ABC transporter substrate-binding protein [Massilia sp. TS11]|uniref:substrate-binding periplasmic protein n=1 Tax=Massilia sp. TS11 TaxID=2908003 RepID=UPI001EDA1653|nr:transporter substrate-binding domain-containing protein [Massilia sp. TS11]MCG2583609.1 transporter substrate-binding domain-containing protein [Massilia sp. TS11]
MRRLLFLGLCCLLGPAAAAPLVVAFDNASMPTQYADAQGAAAGVYPAVVRRAFALMGEPVTLQSLPFRRILQGLRAGSLGAGALVATAERERIGRFSAPYYREELRLYQRSPPQWQFAGLASLHGRTVGVIRGWSYGPAFDAARAAGLFQTEDVGTDFQNFRKLVIGRVDAVVANALAGGMARALPEFRPISPAAQVLSQTPIHLVLPLRPDTPALLRRFDAAVQRLQASGELAQIVERELAQARTAQAAAEAQGASLAQLPPR